MNRFKKIISIIVVALMVIITVPIGSVKADEYIEPKYSLTLTKVKSDALGWDDEGNYNYYFLFNFVGDDNTKYYYRIDSNMADITDLEKIKQTNNAIDCGVLKQSSFSNNYWLNCTLQEAHINTLYLHIIGCSEDENEVGNAYTYPFNYTNIDTINVEGNKVKVTCKVETDYWGGYSPVNNFYLYADSENNKDYINKIKEKEGITTDYIASTNNKNRIEKPIKVLNIHPNASENGHNSAELKDWMEKWGRFYGVDENGNSVQQYGTGRGGIKVTSMTIDEFNLRTPTDSNSLAESIANINTIITLENELKKYDVIVFGTWDANNGKDINSKGAEIIRDFIQGTGYFTEKGEGAVIFGHDTIFHDRTNFATLADLVGIGVLSNVNQKYCWYNGYTGSATQHNWVNMWNETYFGTPASSASMTSMDGQSVVQIAENSIFTKYPWIVGNVNSLLTIPPCHMVGQYYKNNESQSFIKFYHPAYNGLKNNDCGMYMGITWDNFNSYLTVNKKNKTAMIQTGHANCQSTFDERKIWANLIFYLTQEEVNNELTANLYDSVNPKVPSFKGNPSSDNDNKKITFSLNDGKDIDEEFNFYIKTNNSISNDVQTSLEKDVEYQSGFDHFEYYIDEIEASREDITSAASTTSTSIDYNYTDEDCGKTKYIHVRAVDKEGNKSDFAVKSFDIKSNEGTVIVEYIDTNGNEIKTSVSSIGKIGDSYTDFVNQNKLNTITKGDTSYTLKTIPSNASGNYKEEDIVVKLIYQKDKGTVYINYLDEDGNKIELPVSKDGFVGDSYTTTAKNIEGYTLKTTPSNASGKYTKNKITVNYIYTQNEVKASLYLSKNPYLKWTNGDVTITAETNFSGVKKTYNEGIGLVTSYNYVKSITGLGTTTNFTANSYTRTTTRIATKNETYNFSATGILSNVTSKIRIIEIDKDKPVISNYPSENWTKDDVNLNIKLTDSTSGVLNAKLTGNILPVSTKSWSSTTPGSTVSTKTEYYTEKIGTEGRHSYNIEVTDNATNSQTGTFELNIDKTAPVIIGTIGDKFNNKDIEIENNGDYSIISEDIPIKINALDELSGVKEFKLYETDKNFNNEKEIKDSTISNKDSYPEKENGDIEYNLKVNSDYEGYGYHYYIAKAKDEVGNESEIKFKIYFKPEIELLGLTNTYRVPFINQLITERVPGPVVAPLKIISGVKIGMEVDFKGADIAEVEFYKNGNTKINGIKFESSDSTLVTYNKTLATKYVAADWTNGDNGVDNKVSMLISNPDQRNKTHFDFILPNKGANACKHGDVISMKVILYSKEKNKINIELGNKFFYIQDDVEQQLAINNIR